jgi:methionyl-tRNA formyltransferase
MGTPELAAHILERILAASDAEFQIVAVVTRPDQPSGRGLKLKPSQVAAVAERHGVPTLKPVKLKSGQFAAELESFAPDLLVVVAYGRILPPAILAAASVMPINVHASLLPRHRGAAPIEGAILAGDAETGVTIMRMTEAMDAGPMLARRAVAVGTDDTQATLKAKLAELGAEAILETLARLRRGELIETPQDDSQATYTKPVEKSDSIIDWRAPAVRIERMTRAYDPWPVARTTLGANDILVYRARVIDPAGSGAQPGTIVRLAPNPVVQCGEGLLELLEVQAPGRKRMGAAEFARGRRLAPGARLGD